ncbi:MAG: 50S ribosomal protein L17 [Chloroflexi bacterium]|nr:50S ribosomal protein L17 [Chloroflexota bacterium]
MAGKKLGRSMGHRKALKRNLVTQLFLHERIKTTEAKAKFIRGEAEKLITMAKKGIQNPDRFLHMRRQVSARLYDEDVARKLFQEIAPRYMDRQGGYTRILRLGEFRRGDGAELVLIELVEE